MPNSKHHHLFVPTNFLPYAWFGTGIYSTCFQREYGPGSNPVTSSTNSERSLIQYYELFVRFKNLQGQPFMACLKTENNRLPTVANIYCCGTSKIPGRGTTSAACQLLKARMLSKLRKFSVLAISRAADSLTTHFQSRSPHRPPHLVWKLFSSSPRLSHAQAAMAQSVIWQSYGIRS